QLTAALYQANAWRRLAHVRYVTKASPVTVRYDESLGPRCFCKLSYTAVASPCYVPSGMMPEVSTAVAAQQRRRRACQRSVPASRPTSSREARPGTGWYSSRIEGLSSTSSTPRDVS